ncbi:hypothetical protein SDC9_110632 [bioreactor metagenome]|uniref:Uncharacterized protein n=1 Tax=bioreactor metagenome TaxID=1076179 RepID=A0A645BE87_9ZZZZ
MADRDALGHEPARAVHTVRIGQHLAGCIRPEHERGGHDGRAHVGAGGIGQTRELGILHPGLEARAGLVLVVPVLRLLSCTVGRIARLVCAGLAACGGAGRSGAGLGILGGLVWVACVCELFPAASGTRRRAVVCGAKSCCRVRMGAGAGLGRCGVCVGAVPRLADTAGVSDGHAHTRATVAHALQPEGGHVADAGHRVRGAGGRCVVVGLVARRAHSHSGAEWHGVSGSAVAGPRLI